MLMEHAAQHRNVGTPPGDGQKLIDPPYALLPSCVAENRQLLASVQYDVQGRSMAELSACARRGLVNRAVAYTRQYRNVPSNWHDTDSIADLPFILSGHQPQLFHPGVWYKNFVLGRLAHQLGGVGVHLLIDSDLCRSVSVRVPSGTIEQPRVEAVPYDAPSVEVPYEERAIRDLATVKCFAERVISLIEPIVQRPLVESLWPLVMERNPTETNLGLRLAQGRHALEEEFRNETLELPQSSVCQLPEFSWFLAHVLAHLPRFWMAHNEALAAYRKSVGLRNRAQPVPDLAETDGWLESPFWIWTQNDPIRRPLFAQQQAGDLVITNQRDWRFALPLSDDVNAAEAVDRLLDMSARGIKIRTRALTTTLFARVVLGDLFLHGIGGARYDQVTDQIIRAFFGVTPPQFAAVSATLRLPMQRSTTAANNGQDWKLQLRQLRYHPETYLEVNGVVGTNENSIAAKIVSAKRRWIRTPKTRNNARERHLAIVEANESLQPFVDAERRRIERQREVEGQRQRTRTILDSRDYSFCLFPRTHFEQLLLDDRTPGT